jgi:ribosome biogenesis GTPase A
MQALLQRLPSLDAKTNSHTNKSSSMFEIESTVLEQNSTLRQYFNGSSSRKEVFTLLDLANLIHTLRYHLINEYIIGMVGTSNTGKSSLCNKIWNLDTSPSIVNRTVNAHLFYLPEQVSIQKFDIK